MPVYGLHMNKYPQGLFFAALFLIALFTWVGCTHSDTEIGEILYEKTKNKTYKSIQKDSLNAVFKSFLADHAGQLKNPKYLSGFYAAHNYEPVLFRKFYADSSLFYLLDLIERLGEHGLSARPYGLDNLKNAIHRLADKEAIANVETAYRSIVEAEVLFAEALTKYSFALMYGQVNPRKSLPRYYIPVARPDSLLFGRVLSTEDLHTYLNGLQPNDTLYKQMQTALLAGEKLKEEKKLSLIVNLERRRWKMEVDSNFLVYVNVPAYQLVVVKDRQPIEEMKVVVGKADGHETPMLSSRMHSVQVNPIWNIPSSIAKKEILVQAKADKFYLANHGIDVYYRGQKVANADSIDWNGYDEAHLPYNFKQQPGNTNSLGLIKFLFKNGSSVYLHDTPARSAFSRKMRAASHGCVRVEKPLALAHALFGDGDKYDFIKEEMENEHPIAKTISVRPQPQVILDYMTCMQGEGGALEFHKDVYGLDSILYRALK